MSLSVHTYVLLARCSCRFCWSISPRRSSAGWRPMCWNYTTWDLSLLCLVTTPPYPTHQLQKPMLMVTTNFRF